MHLSAYLSLYQSRLTTKNVIYVKQLLNILKQIQTFMQKITTDSCLNSNAFLHRCKIDNINMFKLDRYLKDSMIAKKVPYLH